MHVSKPQFQAGSQSQEGHLGPAHWGCLPRREHRVTRPAIDRRPRPLPRTCKQRGPPGLNLS